MKRTVIVILACLVLLVGVGIGAHQWVTHPRGLPEAVEFAEADLGESITSARVIGLGEATHGNAEFQQLRLELVHKLDDVGVILLEEDFGRLARIDDWVTGGEGEVHQITREFGFVLNHTQEMADFLEGIREINQHRPPERQIHLVGMDVQRVDASKEIALSWLADHDPQAAAELEDQLSGWDDDHDIDPTTLTPPVEELVAAIESGPADEGQRRAGAAAHALQQHLTLEQSSNRSATRAEIMAANLIRTVDAIPQDQQALVFAHNGHLDKSAAAYGGSDLGSALAEHYGDSYRVIGTEFVHNDLISGQQQKRWSVSWTHRTPLRGMYEGTEQGYLEFASASEQNRELLARQVRMGSAGEGFQQWQAWVPWFNSVAMVPLDSYDALVLVSDVTPVRPLR